MRETTTLYGLEQVPVSCRPPGELNAGIARADGTRKADAAKSISSQMLPIDNDMQQTS